MKKVFIALTGLSLCATSVFAEDLSTQQFESVVDTKSSFFVGIEAALASYNTIKMNNDNSNDYIKTHEFNLNNNVFDGLSVLFGFNLGETTRATFKIIQNNVETETSDVSTARYSLHFDLPIIEYKNIAPFVRLGGGYITAEENTEDLSAIILALGLGVNYNINKNVFIYGLFNYDYMPKTELGDTDFEYKESMFSLVMGIGYKF